MKAEGDLDGLYAAMGLGYFARCAMERARSHQFVWGLNVLPLGDVCDQKAVHEECELAHCYLQVFDASFPCGDVSPNSEATKIWV